MFLENKMRKIILALLLVFMVSAVSALDATVHTCLETKDGKYCQPYSSSECNANCEDDCVPMPRENVGACKSGTCYDAVEGICEVGAPRTQCDKYNGQWFDSATGNIAQCKKGCCVAGSQVFFGTEQQCTRQAQVLGVEKDFKPEITNELSCLVLGGGKEEGACVFEGEVENTCRFITKVQCLQAGGKPYPGFLCSSPDLDTVCEKQEKTGCVDGKSEVYWIDSCGNRENIYDINKDKSWNNGKVLSKGESCSISSGTNPLFNQAGCGNCGLFSGNVCGLPKAGIDKTPAIGDYVCKKGSCIDENGTEKANLESWCEYQGTIGVHSGRGADTPGSRHFRKVCVNGEIRTEPCEDYRNQVCVQFEEQGLTTSQCVKNPWEACLGYGKNERDCKENPLCFFKKIIIGKPNPETGAGIEVKQCLPRYPPGFDLKETKEGETSTTSASPSQCNKADKTCVVTYIKTLQHGWQCQKNCECESYLFAEEMHDYCMSLGDCGGKVNYMGTYTKNYKSYGSALTSGYINKIKNYYKKVLGQFVPINLTNMGSSSYFLSNNAWNGAGTEGEDIQATPWSNLGSFGSAGLAYWNWRQLTHQGVTEGLTKGEARAFSYASPTHTYVAMWFYKEFMGLGDTKTEIISFNCKAWQPPRGGSDCAKCGSDGFKCSEYSCSSLGSWCEFLNEGTKDEACVSINPNDLSAPFMSANENEPIGSGLSYSNPTEQGTKVVSDASDGCIQSYTFMNLSVKLNEPAVCAFDTNYSTAAFEDMTGVFGSNLYLRNQTLRFQAPDIRSLGFSGNDPNQRADYNVYVRCQDKAGNANVRVYNFNFCIKPGFDESPPRVTMREPSIDYVKYKATKQNMTIWTDKPAQCRWSDKDEEYEKMQESRTINCTSSGDIRGWECAEFVLPITKTENKVYARCLNQPWLAGTDDEEKRRSNSDSYPIVLRESSSELNIKSMSPNKEVIEANVSPADVRFEVVTEGGMDGSAKCSYKYGDNWVEFFDTGETEHSQVFPLTAGRKTIEVQCTDEAGNSAKDSALFDLKIDNTPPKVTRVYLDRGLLNIITEEDARCSYITEANDTGRKVNLCGFNFNEGSSMTGSETKHTVSFDSKKTYYVKCKDTTNNVPGGCSMIIRGGDIA